MRTLKFALAALIALIIIILATANVADATVRFWPDLTDYGLPASPQVTLPLFFILLVAGMIGFMLGTLREWFREWGVRASGRRANREAEALKAKVDALTREAGDDDIPALASR